MRQQYDPISQKESFKRTLYYALSGFTIVYFNIFGFTVQNIAVLILDILFIILDMFFIIKFFIINSDYSLHIPLKNRIIEQVGLVSTVVIGFILALIFVKPTYENGKLVGIEGDYFLFWIIDFAIYICLIIYLGHNTKKYCWKKI